MEDLLTFLIVFLMRKLLKPSFLKQYKTDLEQYPLVPTSTAKNSRRQSLDSMIDFKGKKMLILGMPGFHIFSQGHVSLIRITFLKLFEKIVMSGFS